MIIGNLIGVGMGGARAGAAPPPGFTLPAALQNLDLLVYGDRLAETYAIGDPMPTVGQPAFTAIDAAREATFRQTPGGFGYLESTLDGYELPFAENPSNFTAVVIGRDWSQNFWTHFGRTKIDSGSAVDSWSISFGNGSINIDSNSGKAFTRHQFSQPNTWWMAALRVSGGMRLARFDTTILSNAAYGSVSITDEPLRLMTRLDTGLGRRFGSGEIALAVYHNGAISDAELDAIYGLRPTS